MPTPREEVTELFNQLVLSDNEIDFITSLDQDGEVSTEISFDPLDINPE